MTEYTGAADGAEDEEENPTPHTEVEDVSLPKKETRAARCCRPSSRIPQVHNATGNKRTKVNTAPPRGRLLLY